MTSEDAGRGSFFLNAAAYISTGFCLAAQPIVRRNARLQEVGAIELKPRIASSCDKRNKVGHRFVDIILDCCHQVLCIGSVIA